MTGDGAWKASVVFAEDMQALRCDFIDVSSSVRDPRQEIPLQPGYQATWQIANESLLKPILW